MVGGGVIHNEVSLIVALQKENSTFELDMAQLRSRVRQLEGTVTSQREEVTGMHTTTHSNTHVHTAIFPVRSSASALCKSYCLGANFLFVADWLLREHIQISPLQVILRPSKPSKQH